MFVDGKQITALYSTVVKSEYGSATVTISLKKLKSAKAESKGALEAQIGVTAWLIAIFPR